MPDGVPEVAADRLRRLKANDTPAILVVVYGNRAFEDALLELSDLSPQAGFRPVAGGAFIGEHSYSTSENPTAHGRPDAGDLWKAAEFGAEIGEKMTGINSPFDIEPLNVPGNHPYRDGWDPGEPMSPLTEEDNCIKCGKCAVVCPVAAITMIDEVTTEEEPCIMCCACVKNCPTGARVMRARMQELSEWLNKNYSERREPETFL